MEDVTCVCRAAALLGEGTLWDEDRGVVWWVDIRSSTIHAHHVESGRNRCQPLHDRLTALALCDDGALLACGDPGIVRACVAADLTIHIEEVLARPEERDGNRFNDAKVDVEGRFWAGTMDDSERDASGSLYWLQGRSLVRVRQGIRVPNGPCFLADGTVLLADSAASTILALRFDRDGRATDEYVFARFDPGQGYPDGMTVDAENHVWVAFWDGSCVRRLSPRGLIVREIALPVRRPTCPVFGGAGLRHLYLSSASTGLDETTLRSEPWSGGLLRLDVGARGVPPHRFRTFAPHSA